MKVIVVLLLVICAFASKKIPACGPGMYFDENQESCLRCAPGQFQPNNYASRCYNCEPGKVQPEEGSTDCVLCPPGEFQHHSGQAFCRKCPIGTFQPNSGSINCVQSADSSCEVGSTNCDLCPHGSIFNGATCEYSSGHP